ncbi:hypothetical protein [Lentilactobacillus kosonis]|uniref:DUF3784 domain-containing protein n=1 Tax=Lentilactobacillus kosonis TaxID=2810561 RepID=A0A401FN71_9LACO|nr:hypothetical protein [Lentilactobacillus kosonis]GAY73787.1 hypothetical protein NBRC111893_1933 [Lentilactobacillus kosonis]
MIIDILVLIMIFISFFMGSYLLTHAKQTLFGLDLSQDLGLRRFVLSNGVVFIILGLIAVIALSINNMTLIIISLILMVIFASVTQAILVFKVTKH